ncbi:unnamed protein product [Acidithrix sp. C25]|nr:unnamed protein product [Acidithrix sp. C25]
MIFLPSMSLSSLIERNSQWRRLINCRWLRKYKERQYKVVVGYLLHELIFNGYQ